MIGFIGGTGPEGKGLALRFAMAGEAVAIGSRDAQRAQDAADEVAALTAGLRVSGGLNEDVASESEVVFIAVPYSGHRPTLESLRDAPGGQVGGRRRSPAAVQQGRGERG